jgi:hypothetical protein
MALSDLIPTNFLTNTFIFQSFIPFLILFAIIWGLLEAINRFSSKVNLIISIGFSLTAVFSNPWILVYIATLGSYAAVILFGMLFLFGVIRWGLGRGRDIYLETSSYDKQYKKLMEERAKLVEKVQSEENPEKQKALVKRIKDIEDKMKILDIKRTPTDV